MLKVQQLEVGVSGRIVINGANLTVEAGTVHAIMGPNGSGKSTLANFLIGNTQYQHLGGKVTWLGQDLLTLNAQQRSLEGLFLAWQNPVEIAGVNNALFLRTAVNAHRKYRGLDPLDSADFMTLAKTKAAEINLDMDFLKRPLNSGFSGGEKKRNEMLQLLLLEPKLAILDEPDSGLDVDALKWVAHGLNYFRANTLHAKKGALVIITHFPRLLKEVRPDFVHLFYQGKIITSGDYQLALDIEKYGYQALIDKAP